MLIISKKKFLKLFENYTLSIYKECGHNLSCKTRAIIKNKINAVAEEYTIKGIFKKVFKKKNKKRA